MAVSGLGRLAGKAAETVRDIIGTAPYPEISDRAPDTCLHAAGQGE